MSKPEVDKIMSKHFVTVPLVVSETPANKSHENAGGEAIKDANGGTKAGLPFLYFSDASGKLIINSNRPAQGADKGGNIGCPYEPQEIAWFLQMVKKAAPKITDGEVTLLKTSFEALKKKDG